MSSRTAIILLAAGESSRLGRLKQLLSYRGTPLVRHVAQVALQSKATEVIVVLGAASGDVQAVLDDLAVRLVVNAEWQTGIASSLRAGLAALPENADAVLILLCDQPSVTPSHLNAIIDRSVHTGASIVASAYADTLGAPALFSRPMFGELLALEGDHGAKQVLLRHRQEAETIPWPEGEVDIDSPDDLHTIA